MKYFKAIDHAGRPHLRSSTSRSYTHCVVVRRTATGEFAWESWAGSLELANRRVAATDGRYSVEIIPAEETTRKEYREIKGWGR